MTGPRHIPLRYFVITFLWSWSLWTPLVLIGAGILHAPWASALLVPIVCLGAFGPLVGALVSIRTLEGPGKVGPWLRRFLDYRLGAKAFILPFLSLGLITAVAWILPEFMGSPRLPMLLPSVFVFPIYLLMMMLIGGGQEEFGWRGYILDPLEATLGAWVGNLVLSVVWAVWHLPLWFIPGASQTYMNFGGFLMLTTGYCFLFRRFRIFAGERPLGGLWFHGLANAFIPITPIFVMKTGVPQPRFWIWVSLTLVAGLALMVEETLRGRRRVAPTA